MTAAAHDSPEGCEAAFYAAFEAGDADAMMAVWARRDDVLCIHPGGPPLTTRDAIAESWRQILAGTAGVKFTLSERSDVDSADVAVRFVHENIHHGPGLRSVSVVCATNVFVREDGGWRLWSHHASPGPAPVGGAPSADSALH